MRPIPLKMRQELDADPTMHECAVANMDCSRKIEFHHVWIHAGRQINEVWAILGVCDFHHKLVDGNKTIRETLQKISLMRATEEDLAKYPRKNWPQIKKYLGLINL